MARILKTGDLAAFLGYLAEQIGQPYLWGGQHTKLTPQNYLSVIKRKETSAANEAAAVAYCKKQFDNGATVLYAYDCSGLGLYWLYNLQRVISSDTTANGMLGFCDRAAEPKKGFWVFRTDSSGKATHIGYMVSDSEVIHAKGRAFGVIKEKYSPTYWHLVGKPRCFDFSEPAPTPITRKYVKVVGGSVRVRDGNGTKFDVLGTAHRGDELPCYGQAEHDPYWYEVDFKGRRGFISCNQKYTELVNKV